MDRLERIGTRSRHFVQLVELEEQFQDTDDTVLALRNAAVRDTLCRNKRYDELWARSYGQYIADRSASVDVLEALRSLTDKPDDDYPDLQIDRQWDDEDFMQIAAATDKLFECLRWKS